MYRLKDMLMLTAERDIGAYSNNYFETKVEDLMDL